MNLTYPQGFRPPNGQGFGHPASLFLEYTQPSSPLTVGRHLGDDGLDVRHPLVVPVVVVGYASGSRRSANSRSRFYVVLRNAAAQPTKVHHIGSSE
jgi:hypothetical protein